MLYVAILYVSIRSVVMRVQYQIKIHFQILDSFHEFNIHSC